MSKIVLDILQKKWWNPKKYRKTSSFSTCIVLDFRFPRVVLNPKKYNPAIRLSNTWWEAEIRCCSIFKSRINFMKYIYFLYWPYWYNVKWNFGRKKYSYLYFSKEFSTKDVKNFKTAVSRYEILVCIFLDFDPSYAVSMSITIIFRYLTKKVPENNLKKAYGDLRHLGISGNSIHSISYIRN